MANDDKPYNLMDGASGKALAVARQVDQQRRISADPEFPLEQRLEAYEDIFDSEVGDTSLVRARNIERHFGFRQIYLKFECGNPTGTQKDRIAFAQAMDALRRGFDTITVATCGNYGVAVALAANFAGLRARIYIPQNYHAQRIKEMTDLGAEIVRIAGDYERTVIDSSVREAKFNQSFAIAMPANLACRNQTPVKSGSGGCFYRYECIGSVTSCG